MTGGCRFFDLEAYSEDPNDWSKWDWPGKVWERIKNRPVSSLGEDQAWLTGVLEDNLSDDGSEKTPERFVTNGEITPLEFVASWIETIDIVPEKCPHEPTTSGDRCPLHRRPSETGSGERELIDEIESGELTDLVGSNFSRLEIRHRTITCATSRTLHLDFCTVRRLELSKSLVEPNLSMRYADVAEFVFDHARFEGDLDVSFADVSTRFSGPHAVFSGQAYGINARLECEHPIDISESIFHRYTCFDGAVFHPAFEMWNAVFHGDVEFRSCSFGNDVNSRWVDFHRFPDFNGTTFHAEANFGGATFYHDAGFSEVDFQGDAHFQTEYNSFDEYAATFHGIADFTRSRFRHCFNLREAEFKKYASFREISVGGPLVLWNAEFDEDADFGNAVLEDDVDFRWVKFHGYGDFNETAFHGLANFGGARFNDDIGFSAATFSGEVRFSGEFSGYDDFKSHFHGIVDFTDATFEDQLTTTAVFHDDVSFSDASFLDTVDIDSQFLGDADFSRTRFDDRINFQYGSRLENGIFDAVESVNTVDMSGVEIRAGVIAQPEDTETHYDFTRATVGEVDLEPVDDEGLFDYFRFYETDFDGFDFPHHGSALIGNWRLHDFAGSDRHRSKSGLINTYLKAKNSAHEVGAQTASSEFFMREMRYRRKKHWESIFKHGPIDRLLGTGRWASSWFLNLSCGYGERPLRTISASFVVILLFAVFYGVVGPMGTESALPLLLFSTQAFVTLIFGQTPEVGSILVQFTAAFQGFLGAFFIALFVFALTRSIQR